MTSRAEDFFRNWCEANVYPTASDTVATPRTLASKCYAEATNQGISADEIAKAVGGNLEEYIADRLDRMASGSPGFGVPELLLAFFGGICLARLLTRNSWTPG